MDENTWLSTTDLDAMAVFIKGKISARKARLFEVACCRRVWDLISEERCQLLMEECERSGGIQFIEKSGGTPRSCRDAVELAEKAADGGVAKADLDKAREAADAFHIPAQFYAACYDECWGPYNQQLMASGDAATAVATACMQDRTMPWAANHAARAVARIKDTNPRFEYDGTQMDAAERAAQCDLLRDIAGNPFRPTLFSLVGRDAWNDDALLKIAQSIYDERAFDRLPALADALEDVGCADAELLGHFRSQKEHARGCWALDIVLGKK